MQKPLALLFALIGTALLASIAYFISVGEIGLVLLSAVVAVLFIGFGFVVKARMRRRNDPQRDRNQKPD